MNNAAAVESCKAQGPQEHRFHAFCVDLLKSVIYSASHYCNCCNNLPVISKITAVEIILHFMMISSIFGLQLCNAAAVKARERNVFF